MSCFRIARASERAPQARASEHVQYGNSLRILQFMKCKLRDHIVIEFEEMRANASEARASNAPRRKNTEYRLQNTEHKVQNTEYRTHATE